MHHQRLMGYSDSQDKRHPMNNYHKIGASLTLTTQKYLCIGYTMETNWFFQFKIIINVLFIALSPSFKYLCYWSTAIINIFILSLPLSTLDIRIWRLRKRQILKWCSV